jgi:hypothetical protein
MDNRGIRVRFPASEIFFSFPWRPDQVWFPPVGTGGSFLGVKLPGPEADHSFPSAAEARSTWSYSYTPQYPIIAWFLIIHRHSFSFRLSLLPTSLILNPKAGSDMFLRSSDDFLRTTRRCILEHTTLHNFCLRNSNFTRKI